MNCEMLQREGDRAVFQMSFDPDTFEREVVSSFREINPSELSRPELVMLSTSALLDSCPNAMIVVKDAVQNLLRKSLPSVTKELSLQPTSDVQFKPASGGFDEPLIIVCEVNTTPQASSLKYEGLKVDYNETFIEGNEVDERIEAACLQYGVTSDNELIEKTKAYESVADMRSALSKSLEALVCEINKSARMEAVVKVLVAENHIEITEKDVERFVFDEIEKVRNQTGEELFASKFQDVDSLSAGIRKDADHVIQLDRMLKSIALEKDFSVNDDDRLKEIESTRRQSIDPKAMEPAEDTLKSLRENPEILAALDTQVTMSKALEYVMEKTVFVPHKRYTLREVMPQGTDLI